MMTRKKAKKVGFARQRRLFASEKTETWEKEQHEAKEKTAAAQQAETDAANTANAIPQKIPRRVKIAPTTRLYMTVEQWHAVPKNPAQARDEIIRANSRKAKHLWTFIPNAHNKVKMARLPNGKCYKISAHTRDCVWISGLSDVIPALIEVDVIPVANIQEAMRHCREYEDSRKAALTTDDVVHGALQEHGISMTSDFLKKSSGLATPLRYTWETYVAQRENALPAITARVKQSAFSPLATADARDYVKLSAPALNALDRINPKKMLCRGVGLFYGPLLTAYLMGYLKYGDKIMTFFERVNEGRCTERDDKMDPVAAARRYMRFRREKKEGAGRREHMLFAAKMLAALDSYLKIPNFDARSRDGTSICSPKINLTRLQVIDLDVYFTQWATKRTGRGENRNSTAGGN
jgi:hypothetical protein